MLKVKTSPVLLLDDMTAAEGVDSAAKVVSQEETESSFDAGDDVAAKAEP